MLVTALAPLLGYDVEARVAKEALAPGRSLREVVVSEGLMDAASLDRTLDPVAMTRRERRLPDDHGAATDVLRWENEGGVVPTATGRALGESARPAARTAHSV
jgi:hypothetical protein